MFDPPASSSMPHLSKYVNEHMYLTLCVKKSADYKVGISVFGKHIALVIPDYAKLEEFNTLHTITSSVRGESSEIYSESV